MQEFDFSKMPEVPAYVFSAKLQKPAYLQDDWIEPLQREYTSEENKVWDQLYKRQIDILPNLACDQFFNGLKELDFNKGGVPDFDKTNEILKSITGWTIIPVPMLIPDHVFF